MINPMDLTGKHILVTGASRGIGKTTAIHLSNLGARVSLVARDEKKLEVAMGMLEGDRHYSYPFDLKKIDRIEGLVKQIVDRSGPLDGLVHSAGVSEMRPLAMTNIDFLHAVMLINFYSYVELIRCASKKKNFREGACFVGMSSVGSVVGDKAKLAYSASKAAMDAATKCMSKELAPKKIRVNTVVAGFVKTDMYDSYTDVVGEETFRSHVLSRQFLGLLQPLDVANAIAYLLSDAAKSITGTGFVVDGGVLA